MTEGTTEFLPLTPAEARELLRIAREAIGAVFGYVAPPAPRCSTRALLARNGAFVTIRHLGELRGCVGNISPDGPLHLTVATMARAAAFDDPRFPPLAPHEWATVDIEISRLSSPRRARAEEVIPGRHGLYVVRGPARGLLLPQVAAEHRWDREEFLRETCRKAGLPSDAWQDPETELLVFEAQVLRERDLEPEETAP